MTSTEIATASVSTRVGGVLRRMPATLALVAVILLIGVICRGLWVPAKDQPWFEWIAYGLPAFEAGRFWTPVSGAFFVVEPWVYIPTVAGFAGMALLEFRRGTRVALLYFWLGQLFAVFASAGFLMVAQLLPWPWAQTLAVSLDVGASGGTMAGIAAAVGLLVAPWRQRAWALVFAYAAISLFLVGSLADLEHAFAIALVLFVDRSFRIQRSSVREQRLIAYWTILSLGIVQLATLVFPTQGPFGRTAPLDGPWVDVAIDTVVIVIHARGGRKGRRWAFILMLIGCSVNMLVAFLILVLLALDPSALDDLYGDPSVTLALAVLWTIVMVYLIATRRAFRVRLRPRIPGQEAVTPDDVRALIKKEGGGNLSWMATWEGMRYSRTSTGIVGFQRHGGCVIVLADPLGAPAGVPASVTEFIAIAERQSLTPCFFSSSQITRDAVPPQWRALIIADDTIVDLPGIEFTGRPWARVRQALTRGDREHMTFRMSRLADEPWGVRQQLRAISESWVGDKGLPEMRFTLGTLQEAEDPEVRLALAIDPDGTVDGFLTWLPVFAPGGAANGWTLDLMRRRDGGFGPVMEYLIGSSAKTFADEGALTLSLSGAPLAHQADPSEGAVAQLLTSLSSMLEPVYGFRSLHFFKSKFNPRYEPIYLLYRDEGDLAPIAAGLTRAFLPDATLRQFAAAGIDLIRKD